MWEHISQKVVVSQHVHGRRRHANQERCSGTLPQAAYALVSPYVPDSIEEAIDSFAAQNAMIVYTHDLF